MAIDVLREQAGDRCRLSIRDGQVLAHAGHRKREALWIGGVHDRRASGFDHVVQEMREVVW
jgi:hypothetical protein